MQLVGVVSMTLGELWGTLGNPWVVGVLWVEPLAAFGSSWESFVGPLGALWESFWCPMRALWNPWESLGAHWGLRANNMCFITASEIKLKSHSGLYVFHKAKLGSRSETYALHILIRGDLGWTRFGNILGSSPKSSFGLFVGIILVLSLVPFGFCFGQGVSQNYQQRRNIWLSIMSLSCARNDCFRHLGVPKNSRGPRKNEIWIDVCWHHFSLLEAFGCQLGS